MLKHIKSWYTPLLKGFQGRAVWSLEKKRHQLQWVPPDTICAELPHIGHEPPVAWSCWVVECGPRFDIRGDVPILGLTTTTLILYPFVWAWIEIAEATKWICQYTILVKTIWTFPGVWKGIAAENWIRPLHFVFFSLQCIFHFQQAILILALDLISDDDFNAIQVSTWFIWIGKYSKKQMHPLWSGWYTPEANMQQPCENDDLQMTGKKLRYPGLCLCFLA